MRIACLLLSSAVLTLLLGPGLTHAGTMKVPGTSVKYPDTCTKMVGNKKVSMKFTGAGTRTKFFVKVYTIGSYVDPTAKVDSARELAHADVAKELQMVLLRDVDGRSIASNFESMIKANHNPGKFPASIRELSTFFQANPVKKGHRVSMTNIPNVGLKVWISTGKSITIKDTEFAKAVWDIYLGPKNVGDSVKTGLTSRL